MKQITLPDNFTPDWRLTDYTARKHAQLMGDRERLTARQNDRIDALASWVAELDEQVAELRELLHLVMQERP